MFNVHVDPTLKEYEAHRHYSALSARSLRQMFQVWRALGDKTSPLAVLLRLVFTDGRLLLLETPSIKSIGQPACKNTSSSTIVHAVAAKSDRDV